MNSNRANIDPAERRAGVRRTVWIVAGLAVAMYVLFFIKQAFWH